MINEASYYFDRGTVNEKEPDEFQQHEEEKNPRISC
jgi:hypothetical protein